MASWKDPIRQVGHSLAGMGQAAFLGPIERQASYIGNRNRITGDLNPPVESLIDIYNTRQCTAAEMWALLEESGIRTEGPFWRKIIDNAASWPDFDLALSAFFRGEIEQSEFDRYFKRFGFRDEEAALLMLSQPWHWSPGEARVLKAVGKIDQANYRGLLKAAGMHQSLDRDRFEALYQPLTYHEAIIARNRQIISDADMQEYLHLEGFTRPKEIEVLKALRAEIPTVSELIEFSVKNVFSKEITEKFGYDDEYEEIPSYHIWMQRNGYIGNPTLSDADLAKLVADREITAHAAEEFKENQDPKLSSWAQAHWRAHWVNMSPTQAYSALHRLRAIDSTKPGPRVPIVPGSDVGGEDGTKVSPFDMQDVDLVLRANDYVPRFRPQLAALSYNVLRLVDIRRVVELSLRDSAFQDRTIGISRIVNPGESPGPALPDATHEQRIDYLRAWARENFLDRGQTPEAATALAELAITGAKRTIDAPQRAAIHQAERRLAKLNERAFATYAISQDDFISGPLASWERLSRFAGVIGPPWPSRYMYDPLPVHHQEVMARLIRAERSQHEYEQAVRSIRLDFVDGGIDQAQAAVMLKSARMVTDKVEEVIVKWSLSMNLRRSLAKTADVLKWYNDLLIDEATALRRLENLGWSNGDALLELELPPPKKSKRARMGKAHAAPEDGMP